MLSLVNNASASTALMLLNKTQSSLQKTQSELSTGLSVSSAADNAAAWSISETMKSDAGAWGAIASGLSQSKTALENGTTVVKSVLSVVNQIKSDIATLSTTSSQSTIDTVAATVKELGKQLTSLVSAATYNGVNLFDGTQTGNFDITASYVNGGTSGSTINKITLDLSSANLTGTGGLLNTGTDLTALTSAALASGTIGATVTAVDTAVANLTTLASTIGATTTRVEQAQTFAQQMQTNLTNGAASMVEADMNTVSTRLAALQTQQQLGVQALSIANQSSQLVLRLFQ